MVYLNVQKHTRASSAEWLRLLTSNHLPLTAVGLNPDRDFWVLSCEEAIQLAYRKSMVLLRCLFVPEIVHRMAPQVFLLL
jgi:hypothetical protein